MPRGVPGEETMTIQNESYRTYVMHMRQEHRRLDESLLRVEEQWARLITLADSVATLSQIVPILQALRAELAHHFEQEEAGGCLEEAVARSPHLSHEAARIEQEHGGLLKQVDHLLSELEQAAKRNLSLDLSTAAFQQFAKELRAHEAAENRVLEESFGMEVE